jgi:hypothetical protein
MTQNKPSKAKEIAYHTGMIVAGGIAFAQGNDAIKEHNAAMQNEGAAQLATYQHNPNAKSWLDDAEEHKDRRNNKALSTAGALMTGAALRRMYKRELVTNRQTPVEASVTQVPSGTEQASASAIPTIHTGMRAGPPPGPASPEQQPPAAPLPPQNPAV